MGKRRNRSRLTRTDVDTIRDMQSDLDYLKQFVVNVPILLMGRQPAILISCSPDVEALCGKAWMVCQNAYCKMTINDKIKEGE
ncbi:MAG: hypothetical protein VZR06_11850 [Butyrivibrio sp.]|nr:hypothetical protein [Butyrivibrio sp.]